MRAVEDADIVRALRRLATRRPDNGGGRSAAAPIDRATVDLLSARGLVSAGAAPEVTAAGRAFLRRRLAGADDFAAQHQLRGASVVDHHLFGRARVTVNHAENPLARLRRHRGRDGRRLIDEAEFAAGERLRADYGRGQIMPRVTADWTATVSGKRRSGGVADATDSALSARARVARALTAVGPEFAGLLVDVCCFLKGLDEVERERMWPVRSAKVVLRLGLARLARHYGLTAAAHGAGRAGKTRHWGADDYRPTIGPSVD